MLRSMLVGLDGSPNSMAATSLGIRWAEEHNAMLVGIATIDEPTVLGPEPVPLGGGAYVPALEQGREEEAERRAKHALEDFSRVCTNAGISSKQLEERGASSDRILYQAQRYDLILLGAKTFFEFATGPRSDETLTRVLKNAPRPVVAVPEKLPPPGPIVVAYDGSVPAARALQIFITSGLPGSHPIHIVTVANKRLEAAKIADHAAEFLGFHQIETEVFPTESNTKPNDVIAEHIEKHAACMIVMGAYGKSRLREFFLGSSTASMIQDTNVPLFLYH